MTGNHGAGRCGQTAPRTSPQERRAPSPGLRHRLHHILRIPREHDPDRHLAVVGGIGRVQRPAPRIEADLPPEARPQLSRQRLCIYGGSSSFIAPGYCLHRDQRFSSRRTKSRPAIVTCRPVWEGGHFRGSEEERRRLLTEALALGADYVDVEWRAHFDDLVAGCHGRRIVLSTHDFDMMPIDLVARVHNVNPRWELSAVLHDLFGEEYFDPSPLGGLPGDYPRPGRSVFVKAKVRF